MTNYKVRVQYEDTDFSGVVYHANYLKFIERARSDKIRKLGIDQIKLSFNSKTFVVRTLFAKFIKPAQFGDYLKVSTYFNRVGGASVQLNQKVFKMDDCIFEADVKLALISNGRVIRLPAEIRNKLLA